MRKKTLAIILITVLALGMMACGDGGAASVINTGNNENAQADAGSNDAEEEFTEIDGRTIQGPATVDLGNYTVDVPEGWLGIHDLDWESLANGDDPVKFDMNYYSLVKGGQTSQDKTGSSPNVDIWYSDEGVEHLMENLKEARDEVTELDLELEGKECIAVHTVLILEDSEPSEDDMVFIPLSENSCIRIITKVSEQGAPTGISIEDSDVLAILNSIQVK